MAALLIISCMGWPPTFSIRAEPVGLSSIRYAYLCQLRYMGFANKRPPISERPYEENGD